MGESEIIRFHCPHCPKVHRAKRESAGRRVQCPVTGKPVTVPEKSLVEESLSAPGAPSHEKAERPPAKRRPGHPHSHSPATADAPTGEGASSKPRRSFVGSVWFWIAYLLGGAILGVLICSFATSVRSTTTGGTSHVVARIFGIEVDAGFHSEQEMYGIVLGWLIRFFFWFLVAGVGIGLIAGAVHQKFSRKPDRLERTERQAEAGGPVSPTGLSVDAGEDRPTRQRLGLTRWRWLGIGAVGIILVLIAVFFLSPFGFNKSENTLSTPIGQYERAEFTRTFDMRLDRSGGVLKGLETADPSLIVYFRTDKQTFGPWHAEDYYVIDSSGKKYKADMISVGGEGFLIHESGGQPVQSVGELTRKRGDYSINIVAFRYRGRLDSNREKIRLGYRDEEIEIEVEPLPARK